MGLGGGRGNGGLLAAAGAAAAACPARRRPPGALTLGDGGRKGALQAQQEAQQKQAARLHGARARWFEGR